MHERNESMVSMKDVAVECGVSIATVSKALNDHSDISEETRRKVKEAATDLDIIRIQQPEHLRRTVHIT